MTLKTFGRTAAIAAIAALALSSCAANEGGGAESDSELSGNLVGIGASAQAAAQEAWVAGFQTQHPDVTISYDPQGSGAGRENFAAGASAFAGSDAFLDDEELAGEFASCAEGTSPIELPVYVSPIAVIYNVEGVDDLNLDADTLANIFNGSIETWDDEAIAELNPDADLPSTAITPVHRSDDSGTTENFTDYLDKAAPDAWTEGVVGTFPNLGGEGAQGTSGLVDAVTNGSGTIGYADASRAGDLGVVNIGVGGEFVPYSAEAAAAVVDGSPRVEGREAGDIAIELDRTTENPEEYPLVLISYVIGCQEYADAADAELAKEYFAYVASEEGQQTAADSAGSAPISPELSTEISEIVETIS